MGEAGAFLRVERTEHGVRPAHESVRDYEEYVIPLALEEQCEQASRCMNCGVAFCQSGVSLGGIGRITGCPLHNLIPETNDLLYRRRFDDAIARLALTNPFPEFTGRVCPAPCEIACNLGLNERPVTINDNERLLSDLAWERGEVSPLAPPASDSPLLSVIGSGPAGLAIAWEMARRGWKVRVYERADRPGGLLMYGIPNMKLPKQVIERRIELMKRSGIEFMCDYDAAAHAKDIVQGSDAVVIAVGANKARDVALKGRELSGIHLALEYLSDVTRSLLDERDPKISAEGKDVVVIGGGDTGTDCVACALRQGAKSVTQVIRAQRPSNVADASMAWPLPRDASSQGYGQREAEEMHGKDPRVFSTDTISFIGKNAVEEVEVQELSYEGERHLIEGTQARIPAQLVLIAKGFVGADAAIFEAFDVLPPERSHVGHRLSVPEGRQAAADAPVYVAGDALHGASLVVNAIADALVCADQIEADRKVR